MSVEIAIRRLRGAAKWTAWLEGTCVSGGHHVAPSRSSILEPHLQR